MKKILSIILLTMLSTTAYAEKKATIEDAYRDMKVYEDTIKAATANATPEQLQYDWETYVDPSSQSGGNELEAQTSTNGYVILNKSQGLIKQWGRISLPGNALGQHRVSFSKRMSSIFAITVSSSDPYTSNSCRGCTIETGARVKSYNSSGFDITNGFVGDSKGGVFAVTLYWEATGKL